MGRWRQLIAAKALTLKAGIIMRRPDVVAVHQEVSTCQIWVKIDQNRYKIEQNRIT